MSAAYEENADYAPSLEDAIETSQLIAQKLGEIVALQRLLDQQLGSLVTARTVDIESARDSLALEIRDTKPVAVLRPYSRAEADSGIGQEKYNDAHEFTDQVHSLLLPYTQAVSYEADIRRPEPLGPHIQDRLLRRAKIGLFKSEHRYADWSEQEGPINHQFKFHYLQTEADAPPVLQTYMIKHLVTGSENPASLRVEFKFDGRDCTSMVISWRAKDTRNKMSQPISEDATKVLCPEDLMGNLDFLRSLSKPTPELIEKYGKQAHMLDAHGAFVVVNLPVEDAQYADTGLRVAAYADIPSNYGGAWEYDNRIPLIDHEYAYDLAQNQFMCTKYKDSTRPSPMTHADYLNWLQFGLRLSGFVS